MWDLEKILTLLLCGQCLTLVAVFVVIIIVPFRRPSGKDKNRMD